jgi:23S rRNA pseudouridine955/2504/2580 synthase
MKPIEIIYQDDEIFVINKPSGLAVQGGQGVAHSVDKDFAAQTGSKVYLVHRLDKDTAGLMVVAKSPVAASKWTKLAGSGEVKKVYEAVCAGRINPEKGIIHESLMQHGAERDAVTHYEVVKKWTVSVNTGSDDANAPKIGTIHEIPMEKLRLTLETGRMHQIRIHLAGQGCFIAGDDKHGDFKRNKLLRKACGIKRLLLASVSLTIPTTSGKKTFSIPLPEHFPPESR